MSIPNVAPLPSTVPVAAKPWWQSRTVWVNALTFLIGLGSLPIVDNKAAPTVAIALGVGNLILRTITTQPLASSANSG